MNLLIIQKISPGELQGIKEPELLASAVNRPKQSAFGSDAYPTIAEKAAALFESLAKNHCFHNANKRTALIAMLQFLSYNGYSFTMPQKQAADFVVDSVNKAHDFEGISALIGDYIEQK